MEHLVSKIIKNENLSENYYLLEIENNFKETCLPGNFMHIKIENNFLRRPFSIAKYNKNSIWILYKIVGKGTEQLSKKKKGDYLDLIGPLGNSFPIFKNKKICIIGGGSGIAPLIFLAREIKKYNKEIYFFYGAKSKNLIFFQLLPCGINYVFSTEDGSFGKKGNIFDVFKNFNNFDVIYGAGPEPLLKKVSLLRRDIPIYISVENYMACGMGLCYGCVIKVKEDEYWEYKRVCKDGPVFEGRKLIWD